MVSQRVGTNTFFVSKWIVDPVASQGTHTTIQGAINAASSGDTIYIRAAAYIENLTLKAGVSLVAFAGLEGDLVNASLIILGKCTLSSSGYVNMSGIQLQTNADNFLVVSDAGAVVTFENCYLNAANATGISISAGTINFNNCRGNMDSTNAFVVATGGNLIVDNLIVTKSGVGNGVSTFSNATLQANYLIFNSTLSTTNSSLISARYSRFGNGNNTAIALTGTSSLTTEFSEFISGTSTAITVGAGCTSTVIVSDISSSNAAVISGAGSISYADLTFPSTSSAITVTTQAILISSCFQNIVRQVFTSTGTYTPTTGMKYCDVETVGGGGGGGGVATTGAATQASAAGGGGGGYARGRFTAIQIGASQAVTIGAAGAAGAAGNNTGGTGGTTSLGALISATGGVGGGGSAANTATGSTPGTGGAGASGDFQTVGSPGIPGTSVLIAGVAQYGVGGGGGSSFFGGGANSINTAGTSAGNAATSYGGGGGGAVNLTSQTQAAGGVGFKGVLIVTEYV